MTRITLLTDFGTRDGYVAAMKGVIAAIAPTALIDDASHEIPPGDIDGAAWALDRYWRLYPSGTVHLVVVDPGVGSARRALAAEIDGRRFVAPDNGVLTGVISGATSISLVRLDDPEFWRRKVSNTFHGRDIFAPVAARLAGGALLHEVGTPIDDPVRLDWRAPSHSPDGASGNVVQVDRFGNLITNIPAAWIPVGAHVEVAGRVIGPIRRTYADVDRGELLALIGSADRLEIAAHLGSAADLLGVNRGAEVRVVSAPAGGTERERRGRG